MDTSYLEKSEWQKLIRYAGNLEQLAGIDRCTYTEGRRDGTRAFEVYNNAGLRYTLMESRCLDIYNLWYRGVHIPPISKPGLVAAPWMDLHGVNYLRSICGGLLYTCGLSNVGSPFQDEGIDDIFHGRIRITPAEKCASHAGLEGNDYVLSVSGEIRDASLFYENLVLKREIVTSMNSKTISINDTLENRGVKDQEYMIMYHLNTGYPVLDEGAKIFIPSSGAKAMNSSAEQFKDQWDKITAPVDNIPDDLFVHSLYHDQDGMVHTAIYNEKIQLGIAYSFDYCAMNYIVEWKCLKPTDYVLGIFPSNNHCAGRGYERKNGTIKIIRPFEQKKLGVRITVLDGEADFKAFRKQFDSCVNKGNGG